MRKRRFFGALALSGIAIATIVTVAYAAVYSAPFQVNGPFLVRSTAGGDGIVMTPRIFGINGWNQINMSSGGPDHFNFNDGYGVITFNNDANIFANDGTEDHIAYSDLEDADPLNDLLSIQGDNISIISNGGDVVVTLGN